MKSLPRLRKSLSQCRGFFQWLVNSKSAKSPTARRFRPSFEILEVRTLLSTWQPVGPSPQYSQTGEQNYAGLVDSIAFASNYDGKGDAAEYIGIDGGGVWRSANFNSPQPSWTPLTDFVGLPGNRLVDPNLGYGSGAMDIGSIAVGPNLAHPGDPRYPQTIYAGTGDFKSNDSASYGTGALRSLDGGKTWQLFMGPNDDFFRQAITKIFVDPTDPSGKTVYLSTAPSMLQGAITKADGIYKSTDGGQNWTKLTGRNEIGAQLAVSDLDYTVTNGKLVLYAGISGVGPDVVL